MKKNALFLAFIILASSVVGCQGSTLSSKEENLDGNITMSSKESFSSSSSDGALLIPDQDMATSADTNMPFELTEADLEEMREYARSFAEFFDTPFASPDELDYEEIGRNSLYWIIVDFGYDSFEKADNGYPLVPKQLLQSYVWEHFGMDDYEFPVSENPNILPQYNAEKDAYCFYEGRGGPEAKVSVVEESILDRTVTYIVQLEYQDFETGATTKTIQMSYTFSIISANTGYSLQAVSASLENNSVEFYSIEKSPMFDVSFEDVEKIFFYDASMGEYQTITDTAKIEEIVNQWQNLSFYDKKAPVDPTIEGLTYQCLYWFEFYNDMNDDSPDFGLGLSPFYVLIGENPYGPFSLVSDQTVSDILSAVHK